MKFRLIPSRVYNHQSSKCYEKARTSGSLQTTSLGYGDIHDIQLRAFNILMQSSKRYQRDTYTKDPCFERVQYEALQSTGCLSYWQATEYGAEWTPIRSSIWICDVWTTWWHINVNYGQKDGLQAMATPTLTVTLGLQKQYKFNSSVCGCNAV
jgi:hypothetical protein